MAQFGDGGPAAFSAQVGQVNGRPAAPARASPDLDSVHVRIPYHVCARRGHLLRRSGIDFPIMQTMRGRTSQLRISAKPGRPATLLDSESPYGSRRVIVEYDSLT